MGDPQVISVINNVILPRYRMTVNEYVPSFMKTVHAVLADENPNESTLIGMERILKNLPYIDGITEKNKTIVQGAHSQVYVKLNPTASAAAAGGKRHRTRRRKMSRKYCKKTPCKKMGFTQKASCRPYKNCYKKKGGNVPVRYVISSHGEQLENRFQIPVGCEIHFYVKNGEVLTCKIEDESKVCWDRSEYDSVHKFYGGDVQDYSLYPDSKNRWQSRVRVCDLAKKGEEEILTKVAEITAKTTLSETVKLISEYHSRNYSGRTAEIHCLFCRVYS